MQTTADNLEFVRRYIAAIERGATGDELAAFYTPDAVQEELPNRLIPAGVRRDVAAILQGAERGQKVMSKQRFTIRNEIASGDRVAVELLWEGTLAVAMGSLPVGGVMRAHFAIFLDMRDGRIAGQRNYDCFEPW